MKAREFYHTQEKRRDRIDSPIRCVNENAWLGEGYYFWAEEIDAIRWGRDKKSRTGKYEIYIAIIDEEDVLDTVFNEEHYYFWLKQIEKIAGKIIKNTGIKPSLKELNDYIREHNIWKEVKGIKFQDLPANKDYLLVKDFYYRKRIQLVVYNKEIILDFIFHREGEA